MNGRRLAVSSMQVVSPPCTTAMSQAARWRWSWGTYAVDRRSVRAGGATRGSMRGPATTTNAQVGDGASHGGDGVEDAAQEGVADAGSADGDDAHPLVVAR